MLRYNTKVTEKEENREPTWYTVAAKETGHERGSLHGKDNTGSTPPSTDDGVSERAWGDRNSNPIQDKPKDSGEVAETVGRDGKKSRRPKP
jgi:hypothetical protein